MLWRHTGSIHYAWSIGLWFFCTTTSFPQTPIVSFDQSLAIRARKISFPARIKQLAYTYITAPAPYTALLAHLKQCYETESIHLTKADDQVRIPHTIHQIWLGTPFPAQYKRYVASWLSHHPTWRYILWTDHTNDPIPDMAQQFAHYQVRSIHELGEFYNKKLYDTAQNWGAKSDILRAAILLQEGGLYVDADVECFKPFDILHSAYTFYAGIEPIECGHLIGNAIIGAAPNHPIIAAYQKRMAPAHTYEQISHLGREMMTVCATGPIALSYAFYRQTQNSHERTIVLPTSYFYPCGLLRPHESIKPESFAAHYWSLAWVG